MSDWRVTFHWRCSVATRWGGGAFFLASSSVSQELLKGEQCKKSVGIFLEETSVQNTGACLWFSHFIQSVLLCQKLTGRRQIVAPSFRPSAPCYTHFFCHWDVDDKMGETVVERNFSPESDPLAIVCTRRGFFVFLFSSESL